MSKSNWQNRIVESGIEDASQLLANPFNARIHPQFQQQALEGVLDSVGWVQRVIVNKATGHVVDGHLRVALAITRGEPVPVDYVELTEAEEKLILASFDYITTMAVYDREQLDALLQDVNSDDARVQEMLAQLAEDNDLYTNGEQPPGEPEAQLNRAEELRDKYGVERGQLWEIGRHRLLCGDSYSLNDIERLIDDSVVTLLHTDPPYGISIVQPRNGTSTAAIGGAKPFGSTAPTNRKGDSAIAERNSGRVGGGRGDLIRHHARAERIPVQHGKPSKNQLAQSNQYPVMRGDVGRGNPANIIQSNVYPVIEGDDHPFDPAPFLNLAPVTILWGANYYADRLPISSCWICWDKREDITRNNFADCELAWTNLDKPARLFHHLWNGLHKGSQWGQRRIHPTEKPVALFEEIGKLYSDGGIWLDLFAGSGAQMVAAERSNATCLALEYEPLYVACILQRMSDMGLTPRLVE